MRCLSVGRHTDGRRKGRRRKQRLLSVVLSEVADHRVFTGEEPLFSSHLNAHWRLINAALSKPSALLYLITGILKKIINTRRKIPVPFHSGTRTTYLLRWKFRIQKNVSYFLISVAQ
ncbi:hypothetical protein CBL_04917 [Carabus blaptoides fortunei]